MTRKNSFAKLKSIIFVILAVTCLLCTSLFGAACKDGKDELKESTYSYTESDQSVLKNASFNIEANTKPDLTSQPLTSVTGWTKATDNSSLSSQINSGLVNVTEWDKLIDNLVSDSDFVNYVRNVMGNKSADKDAVKTYVKNTENNLFLSPDKKGEDDYVYMLNNYCADKYFNLGTAQKLTSSSTLTLEKGKTYKLSVWVKTENLYSNGNKGGANVRLVNKVDGNTQAEYSISNIQTNGWEQYFIYVKPDETYSCTLTLVLGLGYGNGSNAATDDYVEGTVYFDDVKFEEVESGIPSTFESLTYGETQRKQAVAFDGNTYAYDMKVDTTNFLTQVTPVIEGSVTTSNVEGATVSGGDGSFANGVCTLDKSAYTLKINENAPFTVDANSYKLLTFKVQNKLSKFGSTDIAVDLFDKYGDTVEKRAAVATFNTVNEDDEFSTCIILVKNNFDEQREFYLNVVIGPSDIASVKYTNDFASGTVTIKDFYTAEGEIEDASDNKLYTFLSGKANATPALYAGYSADVSTTSEETENYDLQVAPGSVGEILFGAADVKGYYGIETNHIYLGKDFNDENVNKAVNTRKALNNTNGVAGLINTKYLAVYGTEIENAIKNAYDSETENIQPIMIYNKKSSAYGFVGTTQSVSANSYAQVSVTIRVVGDNTKAFVYLVDTSDENKNIIPFNCKDVNTKLMFEVDKTVMGSEKWVTLNFFVGTGKTAKDFRVEIWNGSRAGDSNSEGFVFVKSVKVTTSSAFTEPERYEDAFSVSGNPLFDIGISNLNKLLYTRELTAEEKEFNNEYKNDSSVTAISYKPTYVWAENDTNIYAIYNTIDPQTTDLDSLKPEEDTNKEEKTFEPTSFWMGFSSILLAVVLLLALIVLLVKYLGRKYSKKNKDAKSQYQVKSRVKTHRENQKILSEKAQQKTEEPNDELPKEEEESSTEETSAENKDLDEYVYSDVQSFDDAETNEDKPEQEQESTEQTVEQSDENKTEE